MKIAIPVDGNSMDTTVCQSFGRTPFFLIYDTDSKEGLFLDNSAASSQGGAGIQAAQMIVDHHAESLLTPRCGENAAEVIKAANIKIYRTLGDSLKDNLKSFEEDQLPLLEEIHAGHHHHGGH